MRAQIAIILALTNPISRIFTPDCTPGNEHRTSSIASSSMIARARVTKKKNVCVKDSLVGIARKIVGEKGRLLARVFDSLNI